MEEHYGFNQISPPSSQIRTNTFNSKAHTFNPKEQGNLKLKKTTKPYISHAGTDKKKKKRKKKEKRSRDPAVGVEARVDDAVHVEVEVVELEAVGVGAGEVEGEVGAAGADDGFLLHDVGDGERVSVGEPPVEGRNTHRRRDDRKGEGRDPIVRKTRRCCSFFLLLPF